MADFRVTVPAAGGFAYSYENTAAGRHNVAGEGERNAQVVVFDSAGKHIGGPYVVDRGGQWRGDMVIDPSMIKPPPNPNPNSVAGTVDIKAQQHSGTGQVEYGLSFYVLGG